MHRNQSVSAHSFAMVPRTDIPRSRFNVQTSHKTTFDAGKLIPIYVDEVLPGDTFSLSCTAFGRMATPIFPSHDKALPIIPIVWFGIIGSVLWVSSVILAIALVFWFPRLNPLFLVGLLVYRDYFGLPTVGQVSAGKSVTHSALPFRAYNLIFNEWFRDENLCFFVDPSYRDWETDRKSTRLNSSHITRSRMPSSS